MAAETIRIYDEAVGGERSLRMELPRSDERVPAAELIRRRVAKDLAAWRRREENAPEGLAAGFRDGIRDGFAEGAMPCPWGKMDEEAACRVALEAFDRQAFVLLVDSLHVEDRDTIVRLDETSEVTFLRLVPLVGG